MSERGDLFREPSFPASDDSGCPYCGAECPHCDVLRAERDRYREALEEILERFDLRSYDYQDIASEALESGKKR